ncbi:MAG: hypothetical protein A2261_00015 [Candidatus Magasanikbacteria bacterium RIFOXYA2_FULL_44_8]|uniref:Uncharacterized protein n=1 Tax=Candidatus Magasanikbacteria bacterium RIFOXYA2_FULL_44_8 TaxID=1798696 RepID=A0A1F6NM23_9BACT|nr:MAG: hypothetical protein A2261_00015 [Candidatus Magasanikbacteria bacterium RIFOXYA2_FULL_44_8]
MTSLISSSAAVAEAIKDLVREKIKKRVGSIAEEDSVLVVDISSLYGDTKIKALFYNPRVRVKRSRRNVVLIPDAVFVAARKGGDWLKTDSMAINITMHGTTFDRSERTIGWIHSNSPQGPVHGKISKISNEQLPPVILEFIQKHSHPRKK